ncbi:glycosyltransferase family 2 protein [Vacuolonema iberomarrocanum]|uniref:glycosyltransferase family 2 protein n=1 Tax=Vacuolonema iberomarrocanum TaxID=3454632 RepID=UPI001A0F84F9|nr:glycosyltransferase family 2 protein [filamentous cyanobacterium LEGE 07170]
MTISAPEKEKASSNATASVLVVTVNYRSSRLAVDSLRSLETEVQAMPNLRAAIVDNNSGDDSVEVLSQAIANNNWQDWATLMPSSHNGGYAYGNNYAIRPALATENPPDYFLLLNPDTRIYPGAVQTLVDFMEAHPQAGICGSSLEEADGSPFGIAFRFPSILSELDGGLRLGFVSKLLAQWKIPQPMGDDLKEVDWLSGASLLIRREVFETIGLMDDEYFLYYEETDFCLQAKRAGWSCWYVPTSRVMHIAGQSTGVTVRTDKPKRMPDYWFESRRRYFIKNHGWLYTALTDWIWIHSFALWRMRRLIQRKPDPDPPNFLWDFIRNSVLVGRSMPPNRK